MELKKFKVVCEVRACVSSGSVVVCLGCCNKCDEGDAFNNRSVSSHSSGGEKSERTVLSGLVPSAGWEGSLCSGPFSCHIGGCLHVHLASSLSTGLCPDPPPLGILIILDWEPSLRQCDLVLTNCICSDSVSK